MSAEGDVAATPEGKLPPPIQTTHSPRSGCAAWSPLHPPYSRLSGHTLLGTRPATWTNLIHLRASSDGARCGLCREATVSRKQYGRGVDSVAFVGGRRQQYPTSFLRCATARDSS